jgi:TRAP-type C4-dicarboxylate transport system substrate-binding protein
MASAAGRSPPAAGALAISCLAYGGRFLPHSNKASERTAHASIRPPQQNGRSVVIALRTSAAPAIVAAALIVSLALGGLARAAEQWNFYMHQSAPNFATSRGAKLFTEEIDKATNGEFKVRLHLSGTLQINASNITQAVGENVVQLGDDLFNSGNIPVAGIPRLPMLIQSYEDFAKADVVLKPYIEKAFGQKGSTVLSSYSYPMQVIWGRKKLESLDDIKGMKLRVAQPEQGEFVRRFGGTSITMSAPEVPSALDRGVVEGIFTAGVGAVLWKDLLKYGFVLIVNVNNSYFIANTEAYNKLAPDLQAKVRKVAEDTARWNQDTMKKEEAESQGTLAAAGYTLTNAKPAEIARAVEAVKPYWDEWAKSRGPDTVEALAKVRTALQR